MESVQWDDLVEGKDVEQECFAIKGKISETDLVTRIKLDTK